MRGRDGVTLRLLMVEDDEVDAELVEIALQRAGFVVARARVDDERALRTALAGGRWDVVLCDHGLPQFSSQEALAIVQETEPEAPFIILSGSIGEEATVAAIRSGARDVILKSTWPDSGRSSGASWRSGEPARASSRGRGAGQARGHRGQLQ